MIIPFEAWIRSGACEPIDICIVGAGPAGIDISTALAGGRRRIVVLEAGGRAFDAVAQAQHAHTESGQPLLGGQVFRAGAQGPAADQVRMRVLGGASTIWSGKWKLPDAVDFEHRPWVSSARWPVGWTTLEPHARHVTRDHEVPAEALFRDLDASVRTPDERVVSSRHFEESPPCNFAIKHRAALEQGENLTVVTGAAVCELVPAAGGAGVACAVVCTADGCAHEVKAAVFVLAVGGIETARLLLASRGFGTAGAGNAHGHVGVGFMDHPKSRIGRFHPRRPWDVDFVAGSAAERRQGLFRRITLPPGAQRTLRIPNHALGFHTAEPMQRSVRQLARRFFGQVRPCDVVLFLEQTENAASRVGASDRTDATGRARADVHWALRPEDEHGARVFIDAIRRRIAPSRGRLEIDDDALARSAWTSGSHHMATARMAETERGGVVDSDCRVFSIPNLYVAGTAVFPVGGNANPMILLLALARRLARHLER